MFPKTATDDPAKQDELAKTSPGEKGDFLMLLPQAVVQQVPVAIAVLTLQGQTALVNAAWEKLFPSHPEPEKTPEKNAVKDLESLLENSPEASPIREGIGQVAKQQQPGYAREFSIKTAEGTRWFQLDAQPLDIPGYVIITLTNTSARHKAEQDLRESHSLFHRIVEGTGDAVFIYDMEGRFLMHNSACAELFLKPDARLIGKKIEEVLSPELTQTARTQNELVINTGRTVGYEVIIKHPQGNRTLLIQKGLYRNHQKQIVGIIGVSRDITERKLAEEKMKRSERHFRALIEKSSDCIGVVSERGDILYVSPSAVQMFGFETSQWINGNIFFWLHPQDVKKARERFAAALTVSRTSSTEVRVLCKNGDWKWVEVTLSNLLNDPSVHAIVLNVRDISERKSAEEEMRRFQAIIEYSIDAIFSINLQGTVTSWNPAASRILGYTGEEILGKNHSLIIPKDRGQESAEFIRMVLKGKAIRDLDTVRQSKNGRRVDVSLTFSPIYGQGQTITGLAVILRDITERHRLETEVLEISDFEKQRIGQDLHDDLCQHLVGISMVASRLQKDLQQYGLKQAEKAQQITDMIRNAEDHARMLARGLSPIDFTNGSLATALDKLVQTTEKLFRIPCEFQCTGTLHIGNHEVATHLFRIAQEALNNAVKHSKGTKVIVRLQQLEDILEITVCDNGVGFSQTAKKGSGGLGMHTMSYRARIIGAILSTSSNPQGGLTVACRFRLPIEQRSEPAPGKT